MIGAPNSVRRDFLKTALYGLGLSAIAEFGSHAVAKEAVKPAASLSTEERAVLIAVVETLIPQTATPGAAEVGVPHFIEFMFRRGMEPHQQRAFRDGLSAFMIDSQRLYSPGITGDSPTQRLAYLTTLDAQLFGEESPATKTSTLEVYALVKRLTVIGYFTTEAAALQELDVEPYPGPFVAEKPLSDCTRTFYEDSFGVPLERPLNYLMSHG
jgi:Gluconate 2-dehydrogenase subunit 3